MKVLYLLLLLGMIIFGAHSKAKAQATPNIVFILSDDHSVPYLGCYGNPDMITPNLDKLALEGIRYNRAYTTAPQCVLSRAAIMTGRSTLDIRMTRFSAALHRDIVSFPELLRNAGYFTGLCGRNFHLDGYERKPEEEEKVFIKYNLRTFKDRVDYLNIGWDGETIYRQFVEFLDSVPKEKPFFIQVGYSDPHRVFTAKDFEPDPQKITVPESMPDTKLLRKDLAAHIGEINRCDHDLGRVLDELDKRGLAENTLVVFMGDNGAALLRGKGTLYECGLNVPLIARWSGHIKPGLVNNELISGEDIALTFLEVAGAKKDGEMTGKSFVNSFQNQNFKGHEYVFAVRGSHASSLPVNSASFDLGRVIIGERFKLIYNAIWQIPYEPVDFKGQAFWKELTEMNKEGILDEKFSKAFFQSERPMFEVYDLQNDPFEFNNLAGKQKITETENELKAKLLEWMVLNQDYLPLPIPSSPGK
jgi:arylsulfatase A-like enzyme